MLENFIESSKYSQNLFQTEDEKIVGIEKESLENNVPIITKEVLNFMIFTAKGIKARNILEIGTATGYSGIFLGKIANENGGTFTSIEIDEKRYNKAVENFEKVGILDKNRLILGDALEKIPEIAQIEENSKRETFDFIFIDAAKGQYMKFFEMCYDLLNENGIIFIDNIMFRGLVTSEEKDIPKRYKTIVNRLKQFIEKLNYEYDFVLLPFGDGVGLVRK
ncbi:O-methyltransferase [Pseudoleptotrichia goodfellowii]|uniref:tRNA 5-hydroxyuridine methyltransferase n=2 Tax=Pseudoleptotrichia goodfellowii TaxID=157692 RepID=D0GIR9_9FUSO|nr:O-methyltransferase [Pseudoleptotrichia goodfellowii]EEY36013.1 O-methyltransferase [Pseudoleptotrichia goodfellowii F0264]MBF4805886.1 O-methyltransferase [Pseudoleptotrichia goodfellowii]BBM36999.1 O-methyltransferase family protein [Pseudoleptotrichia goodfellowii]